MLAIRRPFHRFQETEAFQKAMALQSVSTISSIEASGGVWMIGALDLLNNGQGAKWYNACVVTCGTQG